MLDILKKIFLYPLAVLLTLSTNPFGWIVLGIGGYFIYTNPSNSTLMVVFPVWAAVGYGLMPNYTQPLEDE